MAPPGRRPHTARNDKNPKQRERKDSIKKSSPDEPGPAAATLLARVQAHPLIASGEPLAFECRLADDNGWTLGHAVRVVREYRRFLVLTQVAGEQVCPSDDVDKAWQLHLAHRADHERFCEVALGRRPTRDPSARPVDPAAARRVTLARYRSAFGMDAPLATWPLVSLPGTRDPPRRRAIVLPAMLSSRIVLLLVLLVSAVAAGAALALFGLGDDVGQATRIDVALALLATLTASWFAGWASSLRGGKRDRRDTLDPYELAWALGRRRRMAAVALGLMVQRGILDLVVSRNARGQLRNARIVATARVATPLDEHPVERACRGAGEPGRVTFSMACRRVAQSASEIHRRLARAGIADDPATLGRLRAALVGSAWGALMIATSFGVQDLRAGRPVGDFIVVFFLAGLSMAWMLGSMARLTPRGRSVVDKACESAPARDAATAGDGAAGLARKRWSLARQGALAMMGDARFEGIDLALDKEGVPDDA